MREEFNIVTKTRHCVCDDPDWDYSKVTGKCKGGPEKKCKENDMTAYTDRHNNTVCEPRKCDLSVN